MADIRMVRPHTMGLQEARQLAFRWAEVAEQKLEMKCQYEEGKDHDVLAFKRAGAHGQLHVLPDRFELHARLGLLMSAFRSRIESEIAKNLDELLAQPSPLAAFEVALAEQEAKSLAKKSGKA